MKTIVIIAHEFYPVNTGGSHRPFQMAKYLKSIGITPIIITANDQTLEKKRDASLEQIILEAQIKIIRVPVLPENLYSRIAKGYYINILDDTLTRWKSHLFVAIEQLIRENQISTIIVTTPPFSLAKLIKPLSEKYHLPVILDMRDAWSLWNIYPYASKLHYLLTKYLERRSIKASFKTLVTSPVTLQDLIVQHPGINTNKFLPVPNSFEEFLVERKSKITIDKKKKLLIGYAGSFYFDPNALKWQTLPWYKKKIYQWMQYTPFKEEWIYRSPYFLFEAIAGLFDNYPEYRNRIELHIGGVQQNWLSEMIKAFKLSPNVVFHGKLPKSSINEFYKDKDLLLLTSSKRIGSKDYSIAGKTFEYFSLLKPIIALVPEGAQKDILKKSGIALVLDPDDGEKLSQQIKAILDEGVSFYPKYEFLEKYKAKNVFSKMIGEIEGDLHNFKV